MLSPVLKSVSLESSAPAPLGEPFIFHGTANDYFRIWIVNLLLTIVTFGAYAAWAKVRTRTFLRGNLELMGARFDYTANPLRLFIGNVMMVALFLAYSLFGAVYPWMRIAALFIGLCALPWIIVRSLAFNAHNTVYRGMRFRFNPSLSAAALAYLGGGLLTMITLFIGYPVWVHQKRKFQIDGHRFGNGYFLFSTRESSFYSAYLPIWAILGVVIVGLLAAVGISVRHHVGAVRLLPFLVFGIYIPVVYLCRQYVHARLFNLVWNGTQLDDGRFEATMQTGRWLKLQCGNWVAILGTAGLLYPWATIRAARYTASCLKFHPTDQFYQLRRFGQVQGSAIGDSAAEFVGLDFGL